MRMMEPSQNSGAQKASREQFWWRFLLEKYTDGKVCYDHSWMKTILGICKWQLAENMQTTILI